MARLLPTYEYVSQERGDGRERIIRAAVHRSAASASKGRPLASGSTWAHWRRRARREQTASRGAGRCRDLACEAGGREAARGELRAAAGRAVVAQCQPARGPGRPPGVGAPPADPQSQKGVGTRRGTSPRSPCARALTSRPWRRRNGPPSARLVSCAHRRCPAAMLR
eukprot:254537-Prymnesium_polylepis.1